MTPSNTPTTSPPRDTLRELIPPLLIRFLKRMSSSFSRSFPTWKEALKYATGYESEAIIKKTFDSSYKVKNGEAVYERDSVLFDEIQYSWPLLSALMWIAARSKGELHLLDFGGSLGTTYFQNRKFLRNLVSVTWNIVEQKKVVDLGKKFFEDDQLKFHYSIDSCLGPPFPEVILFSGVLQYLEKPFELIDAIQRFSFPYVLIDRTPFVKGDQHKIRVQKVSPKIFDASYPCWFFARERFMRHFKNYEIIADFIGSGSDFCPSVQYLGFIMELRK
jgi:putative methyltransferase (TIGR04325 family)